MIAEAFICFIAFSALNSFCNIGFILMDAAHELTAKEYQINQHISTAVTV